MRRGENPRRHIEPASGARAAARSTAITRKHARQTVQRAMRTRARTGRLPRFSLPTSFALLALRFRKSRTEKILKQVLDEKMEYTNERDKKG